MGPRSTTPAERDEILEELLSIGNLTDEQFRQVKRLRAENEQLRAALQEVVAEGHRDACKITVGRCNCSYSDAVEALGSPKDG